MIVVNTRQLGIWSRVQRMAIILALLVGIIFPPGNQQINNMKVKHQSIILYSECRPKIPNFNGLHAVLDETVLL